MVATCLAAILFKNIMKMGVNLRQAIFSYYYRLCLCYPTP